MRKVLQTICAIALGVACGAVGASEPWFIADPAPEHVYTGGWEHFVGGGVAAFDCDEDALPDLFVAGGENPAQLMRNFSAPGDQLTFRAETPPALALTGVIGAYPLDINSDGRIDLAVLRVGENHLFRGEGDCQFTEFGLPGFDGGEAWTTAFSATWEAGQTLPTLVFGNYVDRSNPDGPFGACDAHMLLRPDGETYMAQRLKPGFCSLSMLFSDWSRSGRADLRVSNDRHYYVSGGAEQLWTLAPTLRLLTEADGWNTYRLWGMGIASRDLNQDGLPEVFLTSIGDQRLQVSRSDTKPDWGDVPFALGTTAHRPYAGGDGRPSTGWHVAFGDVQNDGLDDIFIAKGNVEQMPDAAMDDPNNLLIQKSDGHFTEMGDIAGLASMHRGRGGALVDLNRDGRLDLAVVNRRAPLELYRNAVPGAGNWLSIQLRQPAPNVRAVGAFIEIDTSRDIRVREITIGGGHASGAALPEHFGLGDMTSVRLRVIWPGGVTSDWTEVAANQHLRVSPDGRTLVVTRY